MELPVTIVTQVEVKCPSNIQELLGDTNVYVADVNRERLYIQRASIENANEAFQQTELYTALKDVFDKYPGINEVFLCN